MRAGEASAENMARKDFLPSEAVAIAEALRPIEQEAARERQAEHGGTASGRSANTGGKLPPVKAKTRDKVAAYAGMSGRTLEKAAAVVEAARREPERFAKVAPPRWTRRGA